MADEARAMLDALMGGDRNAPLPSGTSTKRGREGDVVMPSKKQKSAYDHDICPLYCAWNGIDVYALFVNTKSDIGSNPKNVSDSALQEYQGLPKHEQERLGFEFLLFKKLQDLVRMCDRTVARNKEKLVQEKRGKANVNMDYVTTVDERAVEDACRTRLDLDRVLKELESKEEELNRVMKQEAELLVRYEQEKHDKEAASSAVDAKKEDGEESTATKEEDAKDAKAEEVDNETKDMKKEEESKEGDSTDAPADEATPSDNEVKDEAKDEPTQKEGTKDGQEEKEEESPLEKEMRELLLKRQRLLFDLARTMQQYAPIQQAMDSQMEQLHYLKSDITSDKTVCEVSGNFMSARDADERIAAHYAGKQYVGWKLVRDKLKDMIGKYGRYGPPPGESGNRGGGRGGEPRYGGRGGDRDRYNNRDGGRWERGGGGYNRGGYRDDRGGGGHNRGGGDYYGHGGGGGGRDRGHRRR